VFSIAIVNVSEISKKIDYSVGNDSHSAGTTGDSGKRMTEEMRFQMFPENRH